MATRTALCLLGHVLLLAVAAAAAASDAGKIGICHGRVGSNLPPPSAAAALLKQNGITKARLFLPDPAVLPAFAAAGIDLMVGVPNENLTFLSASGPEGAAQWLRSAVLAHVPAERVRYLAVGNEVLYNNQFYAPHLVPAMRNLHAALAALGLSGRVKVSSAHASSVLAASYPPSAGAFDAASLPVLRPMLHGRHWRALHGEHLPFHQLRQRPGQRAARLRALRRRRGARAGRRAGVHQPVRRHGGRVGGRAGEGGLRCRAGRRDRDRVAHGGAPGRDPAERRGVQRQDRGEDGARRRHTQAARRARGGVPVRPVRRGRQARPRVRAPLWHLQGGRRQGVRHQLCLELIVNFWSDGRLVD